MLDSANTFHVKHKEWFISYKFGDFGLAYLDDDTCYWAIGVRGIKMKPHDGIEEVL